LQNKANFKIGKMNISVATIKDYDNEQSTTNVIKTNPIQSQTNPICEKAANERKLLRTKGLLKMNHAGAFAKTNRISKQKPSILSVDKARDHGKSGHQGQTAAGWLG
jgi:hypothetical protein